jgi:hypothetical protein
VIGRKIIGVSRFNCLFSIIFRLILSGLGKMLITRVLPCEKVAL